MPAGRPSLLDRATLDKVVTLITGGLYAETAAAANGIDRTTLHKWLKRGAREVRRVQQHTRRKPHQRELLYVELVNAVEKAAALADARDVTKLDALAQGGIETGYVTTVERRYPILNRDGTQKTKQGVPLFRTEVTTTRRVAKSLPSVAAIIWRLERRNAKDFGRKAALAVDRNDRAKKLPMSAAREILAGNDEEAGLDDDAIAGAIPRADSA